LSVQYGPVFSLKIGKGTAIIITSRRAIHALVDKRSSLYAARPKDDQMHAALKGEAFSVIDPNSDWRIQRKIVVRYLTSKRLDGPLAEIAEAE
jgi:cytochrome P450